MSASTAIGKVSESLMNLLKGEMKLTPKVNVTVLAPDEGGGDTRVNLFLYKIQENPFLRNLEWQAKPGSPGRLVPPPLSLSLFYLMTPYGKNDPATGNAVSHAILGDAMRVFHENPVVPAQYLAPELKEAREEIRIVQNTLDPAELSHVWSTFTQPFRLSVLYQVSTVQLDMLAGRERDMAPRVSAIRVGNVDASFRPPVVGRMEPDRGAAGTTIAFIGENLAGRQADVTINGRAIVDGQALTSDLFTLTLPADLPQGLYEIRVDVSRLFARTFVFEVIP